MTSDPLSRPANRFRLAPPCCAPAGLQPADVAGAGRIGRGRGRHGPLRRGVLRALRDAEPEPERRRRSRDACWRTGAGWPPVSARARRTSCSPARCTAAAVRVVGEPDRGSGAFSLEDAVPGTDALVTTSPAVVLAILTADCVPIVLHDPVAGVLACVHAGWRGTAAGVAAAAVAAMQALGSRPSDVIAGIGPAIARGPLPGRPRCPPGRHPGLRLRRVRCHVPGFGPRPLASRPMGRQPPRPPPGRRPRSPDPHNNPLHRPHHPRRPRCHRKPHRHRRPRGSHRPHAPRLLLQ